MLLMIFHGDLCRWDGGLNYYSLLVKLFFAMNEKKNDVKNAQGERLRKLRDYLGLTQGQMGATCGLKWSQVKDRERGTVEIKLNLANKIAKCHGANPDWLLTGQGEMMSRPGPAVHFIREFQAEYTHNNVIADVGAILASGDTEIISALSSYVRESKRALAERKKLNACEVELEEKRQELAEARRTVDRLSSTHAGAGQRAASSGSGKT